MTDFDSLNRREFLATGVYAGFALATLPITAWALTTSSDGLTIGSISIPIPGSSAQMPGYRAMPKGKGPFPVIVVVHEIFGVHEYIQDVCRRLAKLGYFAISPYFYFREGEVANLKGIDEIRSKVVSKVSIPQVIKDVEATLDFAKATGSGDLNRAGITGFCWGGGITWLAAAQIPRLKAGVAWYGRLTGEASERQPKFPLDLASELKAPVLGLYGGKDGGIPLTDVEKMREKLKTAKVPSEIVVYPEAEHAFHADYRPSYHEKSAIDGWDKMLGWFKKHGVK